MTPRAEILSALEPAQRAAMSGRRLPRRALGFWTASLLIGLRIYVLIAVPLVFYAFFHALRVAGH